MNTAPWFDQMFALSPDAARAFQIARLPLKPMDRPPLSMPSLQRSLRIDGKTHALNSAAGRGGGYGFSTTRQGVALLGIFGPTFKGGYGGAYMCQSMLRADIRQAANDPNVKSLLIILDTPGGSVAGTRDLHDEIRAADKKKPVFAFAEDCCCSAGMWIASAARTLYVNSTTATVGSVGIIASVIDSSVLYQVYGIRVIPIITGEHKATGMEGVPVSDRQIAHLQSIVDGLYAQMAGDISRGRGISRATLDGFEAKTFTGKDAVRNGLADGIKSLDATYAELVEHSEKYTGPNGHARAQIDRMERN
ncbi:MAG TPA: S49 family peptidase [Planctomycetota bacterium]|nr:S49 family peptidase [Planctomycetota bacterium]